jgi:hypothetical protein
MFFRKQKIKKSNLSNLISKSFWGALAFLLCFGWLVRAENVEKDVLLEDKKEIAEESEKEITEENRSSSTTGDKILENLSVEEVEEEGENEENPLDPLLKKGEDQGEGVLKNKNQDKSGEFDQQTEDENQEKEITPFNTPLKGVEKNNQSQENSEEDENQSTKDEKNESNIKIIINEIAWMGTTASSYDEWIELKNLSEEDLDLSGWSLEIGDRKIELEGEIEKGSFYLLERTNDDSVPNIEADLIYTGGLSNGGEDLFLKDDQGNFIDQVKNSQGWKAGDNDNKFTMERSDDNKWQNSFVVNGTPKQENSIKNDENNNNDENDSQTQTYSKKLEITELMPNPEGVDKNKEWVELFNGDEDKIQLKDWYLFNQSGKNFSLDEFEIIPNQFLKIEIKNSSFSVKNSQGWIELKNPNDEIVDKVEYLESAKMNTSYNKKNHQKWEWSIFTTPGKENRFNNPPTFKVDIPEDIYKDVKNEFKIKNAKDKDGEELKYRWEFNTGKRSYIPITTQTFDKKGSYTVEVRVSDRSIDVFKSFKFRVKNFPELDLEIVKLLPNPEGSDSENEKIWIKNNEDKRINLKGWIIATGKNSDNLTNHYIKDDFKIKAGDTEEIKREECAFSLLNKKARVVLKSPDGEIVDKVKYEKDKIEEGEIYLKQEGEWTWESPFLIEKENPVQVLGSNKNTSQKENTINFFDIFSRILSESQSRSDRSRVICFKNWLYSKADKPFFDFVFPGYLKNVI